MITVSGLTKKYGDRTVVDQVSFELEPGTVTGFLGPQQRRLARAVDADEPDDVTRGDDEIET
jgi:ABC-type phosphonate transport system ATPase subunit